MNEIKAIEDFVQLAIDLEAMGERLKADPLFPKIASDVLALEQDFGVAAVAAVKKQMMR
jgi:hypothetical protein